MVAASEKSAHGDFHQWQGSEQTDLICPLAVFRQQNAVIQSMISERASIMQKQSITGGLGARLVAGKMSYKRYHNQFTGCGARVETGTGSCAVVVGNLMFEP
jgi:hypothetical protein